MFIVALTGGIATGKSAVADVFKRNGTDVIDADEIAREVLRPGTSAYAKLRAAFDARYFDEQSGELRREELAHLIFHDPESRSRLNEIVYPEVRKQTIKRLIVSAVKLKRYVVLDIPLFFEANLDRFVKTCIVVHWIFSTEATEVRRLAARDDLTLEEARARIGTQMMIGEKMRRASHLVNNDGTVEETERQVEQIIDEFGRSWQPFVVRAATLSIVAGLAVLSWIAVKSQRAGSDV